MKKIWSPLCLVAECDWALTTWPISVARVDYDLTMRLEDRVVSTAEWYPHVVCAVSLTSTGAEVLDRLETQISSENRSLELMRYDLGSINELSEIVVTALSEALVQVQLRAAHQNRELAQMRKMTEHNLTNFEKLEAFVWQIGKGERIPVIHLGRREGTGVEVNRHIEQRLPGDSAGLSDIAIWIESDVTGRLTARLILAETGETAAEWEVDNPPSGWLRLALPRALGSDLQTPFLHLSFQGTQLYLGQSLDHPDSRFQCQGGPVLALRLWKFIPGATAPMTPDSKPPTGQNRRWLIGLHSLVEAAHGIDQITFVDWETGIVFQPHAGQTLTLRLRGMARPEMRHIQANIVVAGKDCYADVALLIPDHSPMWQRITSQEPGQVHIPTHAMTDVTDLLLVVRAPPDCMPHVFVQRIEAFSVVMGQNV